MSQRQGHNEASLFVHARDSNAISELITEQLSQIPAVSAVWIIHLFKPRFFPIPADSEKMKRFVITAKIKPDSLSEVYSQLTDPNLPNGLKKVYYAYTFHLYDETLQYSLLAGSAETLKQYIAEKLDKIKSILKIELHPIEKTKPFISYNEWQEYEGGSDAIPTWQQHMVS